MTLRNSRIHRGIIISGETIGVSQQILTELRSAGHAKEAGPHFLHFCFRTSVQKNALSALSPLLIWLRIRVPLQVPAGRSNCCVAKESHRHFGATFSARRRQMTQQLSPTLRYPVPFVMFS